MSILKYEYLKISVCLFVLRFLACLGLDELLAITSSEQASDLRIWMFCHLLPSQLSLRPDATNHSSRIGMLNVIQVGKAPRFAIYYLWNIGISWDQQICKQMTHRFTMQNYYTSSDKSIHWQKICMYHYSHSFLSYNSQRISGRSFESSYLCIHRCNNLAIDQFINAHVPTIRSAPGPVK